MYICKECNLKYKIKPEYCNCGNDTFQYIEDEPQKAEKHIRHNLTLEEKSEIVSRIFFVICIIFAVLVWFIPMSSKPAQPQATTQPNVINKNIPDITKIWNDTPIYQPETEKPIIQTEPIILTPTAPVQKKNLDKPISKAPVTNVKQQITEPPKAVQKPQAPVVKQPVQEPVKIVETPKKIEPQKPVYNPNSPTMIDYKTKLRAKLFTKFAVGSIQGSGSCSISFSIDKSGKLINRKFTRESDNKSLNDTVYYMLMSVPTFSAPPAEYDGSPLNMTFKINNGNFEISIY